MDFPVVFAAGETEQFVEVGIEADNVYESSLEAFEAALSLPAGSTGVVLGQQSQATATIQDNNGKLYSIACSWGTRIHSMSTIINFILCIVIQY